MTSTHPKILLKDLPVERVDTKRGIAARWRVPYYDQAGVKRELYMMMIKDPLDPDFKDHLEDGQKQFDIAVAAREKEGCRFHDIFNGIHLATPDVTKH